MSNQIVPFEFEQHEVRVIRANGEPWFVLADLCKVLGLGNPSTTAARIDEDALSSAEVIDAMGRQQRASVVSEAGMYQVIFMSRRDEAQAFRRWVTNEVLPEIRRTGSYAAPKPLEVRSLELLGELTAEVQRQQSEIAELAPKADAWEGLASGSGTYSVADAAKMLNQVGIVTGRDRLFQFMHGLGWVYRQSGRWQAKQTAVDTGRLYHKPQSHLHPETGETVLDAPQVRVTMKGVEQLRIAMLEPVAELEAVSA